MDLPLRLNHIFVDYENVQALDLGLIGSKGVTFTLLVGRQTMKLEMEIVEQLLANAASVELVRLTESGRNALDFYAGLLPWMRGGSRSGGLLSHYFQGCGLRPDD